MSITVTCRCGQSFAARPEHAGRTLPCPVCRQPIVVPQAEEIKLQPLAPAATPRPTTFAPKPASSSGGMNLTLVLAIGGGVAVVLMLMCGVIGGVAYYQFSKPREVAKMPPGFGAPPVQFTQQPNFGPPPGSFGPPTNPYMQQGPATPPSFSRGSPFPSNGSTGGSTANSIALPGMRLHTEPGVFSMSTPLAWQWTTDPRTTMAGMPASVYSARESAATGRIEVMVIDIPHATQDQRSGCLEGRYESIQKVARETNLRVTQINGLDWKQKIPDDLNYSFTLNGDVQVHGGGRMIFSPKHIVLLRAHAPDSRIYRELSKAMGTFREL